MSPKSREFKALKALWYKKLAKTGFEDIEMDEYRLERYHSFDFPGQQPLSFEMRQRYFELANQLLHAHKFKSPKERNIWKLHASGWTVRDIAKKHGYKDKHSIDIVINRLAKFIKGE